MGSRLVVSDYCTREPSLHLAMTFNMEPPIQKWVVDTNPHLNEATQICTHLEVCDLLSIGIAGYFQALGLGFRETR